MEVCGKLCMTLHARERSSGGGGGGSPSTCYSCSKVYAGAVVGPAAEVSSSAWQMKLANVGSSMAFSSSFMRSGAASTWWGTASRQAVSSSPHRANAGPASRGAQPPHLGQRLRERRVGQPRAHELGGAQPAELRVRQPRQLLVLLALGRARRRWRHRGGGGARFRLRLPRLRLRSRSSGRSRRCSSRSRSAARCLPVPLVARRAAVRQPARRALVLGLAPRAHLARLAHYCTLRASAVRRLDSLPYLKIFTKMRGEIPLHPHHC